MAEAADELIEQARALLREGCSDRGIECLRRAVEIQPDHVEAWGHLSGQLARAGQHAEALRCIEQVLGLDPGNREARWRRADRLLRLGRLDEAEADYRAVLEVDPQCHDARCGLKCIEWLRRRKKRGQTGKYEAESALVDAQDVAVAATRNAGGHEQEKTRNERQAMEHFERGDRRLRSLPFHIHVETTTRCNAACITCPKGHGPYYAEDLGPGVFERIERELMPKATHINLSGAGEPLLVRGFERFYDAAARSGARLYLVTNATLLPMARLEKFARRPTDLVASIDGARPETSDSIRRLTRFDRIVESLRLYKKLRDVYAEAGSTLAISFVAIRRNVEELPALVDLAAELGAQSVAVLDLQTYGIPTEIARESLSQYPELANRLFDEAAERARRREIVLQLPAKYGPRPVPTEASWLRRLRNVGRLLPERERFPKRCDDPWTRVHVSPDGSVHPCCASRRVMGDLGRQRFADIWNCRRYRWFRRRIRSFLPPPECRHCNTLWGINAGNPWASRAGEGLVVKLLYRLEAWWLRQIGRARGLFVRPAPPPAPNYAAGRPIRAKASAQSGG